MKTLKKLLIIALAVMLILPLIGCGDPEDEGANNEPINIAFVFGIADGETKINDGIAELTTLPALPGTEYAFISVEGTPTLIGEPMTIFDYSDRGYTDVMMERLRAGVRADLSQRLASYEPSSLDLDIAAAVDLAVRTLNAHAKDGRKNILVLYCSGKSTCGLINMAETPIYRIDIDVSVPAVAEKMKLDMSNIDEVIWYTCGTCGGVNQEVLSPNERAKMEAFYDGLFRYLGAKNVTFKDDLPKAEYYCFADCPVSRMDVEGTTSGLAELTVYYDIVEEAVDTQEVILRLDDTKVAFKPDEDSFVDESAAREAVRPFAQFLCANPDQRVLLAGSTATGSSRDRCMALSKARSERIRSLLIGEGVDPSQIDCIGLGQEQTSLRAEDLAEDGSLVEHEAVKNRCVYVILLPSATADELLQIGN